MAELDREQQPVYTLIIEAWDNYQFGFTSGESRNAFKQIRSALPSRVRLGWVKLHLRCNVLRLVSYVIADILFCFV